jgi:hypothetical protein
MLNEKAILGSGGVILLISLAFSKSAISVLIPHVDTQPE